MVFFSIYGSYIDWLERRAYNNATMSASVLMLLTIISTWVGAFQDENGGQLKEMSEPKYVESEYLSITIYL